MSSAENIPLKNPRKIEVVDISDEDNDQPINNSHPTDKEQTPSRTGPQKLKRSINEVRRSDNQPKRKKTKIEIKCPSAKGNQSTSNTTIEIVDFRDDGNENENKNEVHQNGITLNKQLIVKEKQHEKCEKERIDQNKQIIEKALQKCKKVSQLEQPKVIGQKKKKKQILNLR
jgi:hypothetical protein